MKGEYSYIGVDGNEWKVPRTHIVFITLHRYEKVEWYADETGFHPSAPFLPKSVEPNHPEVAAAVRNIFIILTISQQCCDEKQSNV